MSQIQEDDEQYDSTSELNDLNTNTVDSNDRLAWDRELALLNRMDPWQSHLMNLAKTKVFLIKLDRLSFISSKYESLDYDVVENKMLMEEEELMGYGYFVKKNLVKWFAFFIIGVLTATVASTVDITINLLIKIKYETLVEQIENYQHAHVYVPMLIWVMLNLVPFTIGSVMVTYLEPNAAGSGIPLVKCYLNGVKIPRVFSIRTLFVKGCGLACSVVGGVASGKEGPMIHIGACVANMVSMGYINICGTSVHWARYFRNDQEKRDLISAGAASGVSAAFGASVGGVLFSLEEGASFWNQTLTWRIFFASVISSFVTNLILSAHYGHFGELTHSSLVNLGKTNFKYDIVELPIFMLMGTIGGLLGAFWNYLNYQINILRTRYLRKRWSRVIEAGSVAALHAIVAFEMSYLIRGCRDLKHHYRSSFLTNAWCKPVDGQPTYNLMATMWLQTPQSSANSLIHDADGTYSPLSLAVFTLAYFICSFVTFGLSSSNGIFVPSLLTGAAWGRLACVFAKRIFVNWKFLDPGKYALIGGAAQLGGMVRMTISLTVIIMETSDNISFSLPIILTLVCAKWTGDFFAAGIYDTNIRLKAAPFIYPDPPVMTNNIAVSEFMNKPVICLKTVETVEFVIGILENTTHNGFPVVEVDDPDAEPRVGKIKGIILRAHLLVLLVKKMFVETRELWKQYETCDTFRDSYLEPYTIDNVELMGMELNYTIDFTSFMNNSPYTLLEKASLPRVFRLFRALGLRHLPIVDESNVVVGMVTRKDIARFRIAKSKGRVQLTEVPIHH